jgi:ribosomal protein L29
MKMKEMRKLNREQLMTQLHDARLELAKERASSEIGTAKNPGRIRTLRKTIARTNTIINEPKAQKTEKIKASVDTKKTAAKPAVKKMENQRVM